MQELLAELEAAGWSRRAIARATGLSRRTVDEIATGERSTVTYRTVRILVAFTDRLKRR